MALRAGFHGTVGQPSAQVIDGSLKFAGGTTGSSNQYLEHTFSSNGNRKTFTLSFWLKRSDVEAYPGIFFCGSSSVDPNNLHMYFNGDTLLLYSLKDGSNVRSYNTTQQFRDLSGWYHIVVAVDSTISSPALDRFKVYVNGDRVTEFSSSNHNAVDENTDFTINQSGKKLEIGLLRNSGGVLSYTYNGNMSQWYSIDGLALGPGYFGFTDPLTGTWRPKKFRAEGTTVNDGTQWSSLVDVSNATVNNGSAANLFDGDTTTKINITAGYIEIDLSSRDVQAGPEGIEVYNNEGGAYTSYQVNGGEVINWQASAGWMSMGGANSKINTIRINYLSGGGVNAAFAFRVNGVIMVDSTTTNLDFGTNGFYLPMDGNSPIGQDKSGKGNDFTPVNFGGSNSIDKASGALPILNTVNGGNHAVAGVRTDANASNLVLALPLVGSANDVSNRINSGSTTKSITVNNAVTNSTFSNFYGGSYYFDGSGDSLSVASSSDLGMGTGDFTVEAWVYPTSLASSDFIVCLSGSDSVFGYNSDGTLNIQLPSSGAPSLTQKGPVIVANKWNHFACVRESGALRGYIDGVLAATVDSATTDMGSSGTATIGDHPSLSREVTGYIQDVRIYKGVAKYTDSFVPASTNPDILPDTPSGVSGSSKLTKITDGAVAFGSTGYMTTTSSDYNPGTGDFAIEGYFRFPNNSGTRRAFINDTGTFGNNSLVIRQYNTGFEFYCGGTSVSDSGFNMAQWNHAMITRSGSTARFFVNGELRATRTTSQSISCEPSNQMTIGGLYDSGGGSEYMQGHASNLRLTVGSIPTDYQTSSTTVGEMIFTPSSEPLTSTSQGANSSHVKLLCCQSNTSATAAVSSASLSTNNTVTATNFNPFNTDINTVRGQETGYCTINPLDNPGEAPYGNQGATILNGNLEISATGGSYAMRKGTLAVPSSGKFYYEATVNGSAASRSSSSQTSGIGLIKSNVITDGNAPITDNHTLWLGDNGYGKPFGSATRVDWFGATIDQGDILSFACDMDANTFEFKVNGISAQSGNINTTEPVHPFVFSSGTSNTNLTLNFGQKPFKFPPPDGFQPLNLANVRPETVIARPDQYVGVTTWSGDNVDGREIDMGMSPDLIWVKTRNQTNWHWLSDSLRGTADKRYKLYSNDTTVEDTAPIYGQADSFNDFGFVAGGGTNDAGEHLSDSNKSGTNYVCWSWKAGGSKGTFNIDDVAYPSAAAAGLDGGSLDPSGASVGTKQGFSILKYSGASGAKSISHGLSQAPTFIIVKCISGVSSQNWTIYHKDLPTGDYLKFTTDDKTDYPMFNDSTPNSSTIPLGNDDQVSGSSGTYILYAWHDVPGLQKFGIYNSNGSTDGNFVELGFRPAILWIKSVVHEADTTSWCIFTDETYPNNPFQKPLYANRNINEGYRGNGTNEGTFDIDLLSNGFKLRTNVGEVNEGGANDTYVYCAWAKAPASNLYGGQSNAR